MEFAIIIIVEYISFKGFLKVNFSITKLKQFVLKIIRPAGAFKDLLHKFKNLQFL